MITTRFPNRTPRTVWGNLNGVQLLVLGAAVTCLVVASAAPNGRGMVLLPVAIAFVGLALARWEGRLVLDQLPIVAGWASKTRSGQDKWRRDPLAAPREGALALPGDAARLRWRTMASGTVAVYDPSTGSVSASVSCRQPAFRLLATTDQERRVDSWASLLGSLSQRAHGARVQVTETTIPDPGLNVAEYFDAHAGDTASWAASEYRALLDAQATRGVRHDTTVTVSINVRRRSGLGIERATRGSALDNTLERLDALIGVLVTSLTDGGLQQVTPITEEDLATRIVQAYRPTATVPTAATLAEAGPISLDEHRTHLDLVDGCAAVLWVAAWPRTEVPVDFLHHVLFTSGVQKTFSLFITPVPTLEALKGMSKEAARADAKARDASRRGRQQSVFERRAADELAERENALADGYADARFSGFIVVTAPTLPELADAVDAIEAAAAASGIHTEPMARQHLQAFTTVRLPLGRKVHR